MGDPSEIFKFAEQAFQGLNYTHNLYAPYDATSAEAVQINGFVLQTPNYAVFGTQTTNTTYFPHVSIASSSHSEPIMQTSKLPNFPVGPIIYTYQTYKNYPTGWSIPNSNATTLPANPSVRQSPIEPMEVDQQCNDKELKDISTSTDNFIRTSNIYTQTSADVYTSTEDLWVTDHRYKPSWSKLREVQETSAECSTSTSDLYPPEDNGNNGDDTPFYVCEETETDRSMYTYQSCVSQCVTQGRELKHAKKRTKISGKDMDNDCSAKTDFPRGTITLSTPTLNGNAQSSSPSSGYRRV